LRGTAGRLHYGLLMRGGEVLDEVLVAVVQESAGCESVEINCHGGVVAVERVMAGLEELGVRRVSGEELLAADCTLDAIRLEAARALPHAHSRQAVRMLLAQHRGELSRALTEIARQPARDAAAWLADLEAAAPLGLALCTPRRVVIAGQPNTGKSTLFNALLGRARAIVTDVPGTTRDYVSDSLVLEGVPLELIDTAGLRETDHAIEIEGVKCAREQISSADIVVLVFDATQPMTSEEQLIVDRLSGKCIRVLNKMDLLPPGRRPKVEGATSAVTISASRGDGMRELEAAIVRAAVGSLRYSGGPAVFTQRQLKAVGAARAAAAKDDESFRHMLQDAVYGGV